MHYETAPPDYINHLISESHFCGQVNQSVRYVHYCRQLVILIKISTNNPSRKSVVLESSVKPSLLSNQTKAWLDSRFKNHPWYKPVQSGSGVNYIFRCSNYEFYISALLQHETTFETSWVNYCWNFLRQWFLNHLAKSSHGWWTDSQGVVLIND